MNKVIISGNLTKDPDVRRFTGENASVMARFNVACRRKYKSKDGKNISDFPSVVAWGNNAEFIEKYFHKGDRIEIVGELQTGSYTNSDGKKVYTTDVVVTEVDFGGKKSGNQDMSSNNQSSNQNDNFMNIPDDSADELPWTT